ncbi:hypothetical protein SAMN05443270_0445 [Lacrimispora sphenoides]|jgi:hypothetical protein|uniref:hypothetical protein n=1 Tax=Lacrimispora sphenoides TaxID=29370 RepID=UPI0008C2E6CF|nr:hypothetical protein [Lacrimispora sphenoides]SET54798.1 hypothetical protein SAMN05443270_0445 [Lacrimispora sphenoides]
MSSVTPGQETKTFSSVYELEAYLQALQGAENSEYKEVVKVPRAVNVPRGIARAGAYQDTHTFSWYNPFAGFDGITLLCWSNVDMTYSYDYVNGWPKYSSIDSVTSYLTGIHTTTWSQTSYSRNFYTDTHANDSVKTTVKGTYTLGIAIADYNVGATRKGTWTVKLTLVPE